MILKPELEERYLVVKISDLTPSERLFIEDYLWDREIATVAGIVIEDDWPEYQPTKDLLLGRIAREEASD